MLNTYIAHLKTSSMITVVTTLETMTIPVDHLNYVKAVEAIKAKDFTLLVELADAAQAINIFGRGLVSVIDGVVMYQGTRVDEAMNSRIIRMVQEGEDVQPMLSFLDNLMQNPSGRAVKELYRFMECNQLPLTQDGHLLAYKNVSDDYRDKHTGRFDNSIGSVCEMPRNQVMDDPNQTCSAGLHFCSIEYLNQMWGHSGHTMVVKINPMDVVSIPVDYNNSKGRCSRYTVIAEHMDKEKDTLSESAVYYEDEYLDDYLEDYDESDYCPECGEEYS